MMTDSKEAKLDARVEVTVSEGPERRRQGKIQPFQHRLGKKKRREAERGFEGSELKPSYSTDRVCNGVVSVIKENDQYLRELKTLGSRAFSHESVFITEDSEETYPGQTMSQENVSDKVRNIQRQIGHNIKFGQRLPSLRKSEGDEGSSDEEEMPRSPLRVPAQVENEPPETEAKENAGSHDTVDHRAPVKSPRTKRPPPPGTIESINLDAVPQSVPRLDNTAAKHKLSVKPKNQRVSRKHRRFTQEFQEEDFSEMQEQSETQKDEEVFDLPKEDYKIIHWSKEDYEPTEKSTRRRFHEEELERLELQRREQEVERKMEEQQRRIEEQRLEEEKLRRQEEDRLQKEEEERMQQEEEARKEKEEEERRREEEEQRLKSEEEQKRQEDERMRKEEEERRRAEEERRQQELEAEHLRLKEEREREQEERLRKEEEEAEQRKIQELEEKRQREEEQRLRAEERSRQEEAERKRLEENEERKGQQQEEKAGATDPEWKRKAEELRWREMEERQRPFTFKVSSGEKQILFQKVNLTPVTLSTGQQGESTAETSEGAKASSPGCTDSPTLSSSLYVPHTAILVTGAQLCGTAVNLDQIKDTACKSLLGLSEGKKAMSTPPTKSRSSPDRKSGKNKSLYESSLSADQSNAAVLAEWASIRSKIFKGAEDGKYPEYLDQSRRPISEDLNTVPFSHSNLMKTMSASAKFSIIPARVKFTDSNRRSESSGQEDKEGVTIESPSMEIPSVQKSELPSLGTKIQSRGSKVVHIADSVEECMFAKDLPSFLVPSPPHGSPKSQRSETGSPSQAESEDLDPKDERDQKDQSGDERPSPFGIKLRRTNYSLRFHNEQSAEKRKKRYSAGDSFEGVPVPLTSTDQDSDTSTFSETSSPVSPQLEITGFQTTTAPSKESQSKFSRNTLPLACTEADHFVPKPPFYQKPATSPKPSEGATPPPSPLPKPGRRTSGEMISLRTGQAEQIDAEQSSDQKEEVAGSVPSQKNGQGEGELKEKKSFFPSISIPWREKTDRRTELIKKEKPSLQARHSLDSSRTQEKETGPLWITLALQKQKGFREHQQTREERKSQREAKLAEKQARDRDSAGMISPTEDKGNGSSRPLKPQTADENKRPDSLLARFERRDNLKKANTLPSSVTVEITDSTPSPPATKDVTKRFPPGDTTQVSTEPAWLALAKRKAKAWSDCPQIIK
ncbi:capping protein inhibiting regulator of actin dynamics-like isoform X2 [Carassius gibelio]|uniref:capping protein inhibiting regulator of actin dynamics-like isoform X2 n=2 Tax=Carassius gibelio TaxID=101364 RepID=UPI002279B3E0|nr:capping protein inhibiting regulator of actin dynamics-like isoform X2 [Carassius gibelio]